MNQHQAQPQLQQQQQHSYQQAQHYQRRQPRHHLQEQQPVRGSGGGIGQGPQHHNAGGRQLHPNEEIMTLNQKNHRLAKELSDLRVRHREETKVVSRLTMENMNLASRCREAISQVASLKKEILVYQKRQSEWTTLQKEVMQLRKQIDKNAASNSANENAAPNNIEKNQQSSTSSPRGTVGNGVELKSSSNEERSDSPATDLDRIMSQQFRKQDKSSSAPKLSTKSAMTESANKIPSTGGSVGIKGARVENNLLTSSNTKIPISVTSSKSNIINGTLAATASQKDDEFDADIDMVDFFAKSQSLLNNTGNGASSSTEPSASSNHLGSRKAHHIRNLKSTDDHMPGDVVSITSPSKGGGSGINGGVGSNNNGKKSPSDNLLSSLDAFEASFASAFPETSFSITSDPAPLSSAKLDMSFDVPDFDPFFKSPNNNNHKQQDISIASSSAPVSSSSVGSAGNASKNSGMKSQMIQDFFPESAMNFKSSKSPNLDMAFDLNPMSFATMDKMKGMATASSSSSTAAAPKKLDMAFSRVQAKGKSNNTGTNLDLSKEDKQATSQRRVGSGNSSLNHHSRPAMALSPQSMSAEIEQLDAIANLASSKSETNESLANSGSGMTSATGAAANTVPSSRATTMRSFRKVKQPVSYAEPSTKAKLRRGDVYFPKVDSADKNKMVAGGNVGRTAATSPTTDLDRIMGQMATPSAPSDVQ
eukprot:CAMPEP_0183726970 /NCGR_PEP_ID=MMETSP0737-20130205/24465_1 /TAXON_ID=385413 /ORGANISM="Thalassiosira miniscula, Strain CCMP1093" /LENGTH=705 /DNA_ID=CAMNT_0025958465 /DNA_START=214 /DNA_END=2331 /DNA_ORIENTATION=-